MSKRKLTKQDLQPVSDDLTDQSFSTSTDKIASLDADKVKEMIKALQNTPVITWSSRPTSFSFGRSNYQEPERDEQGTLYGYKVLVINLKEGKWFSPLYPLKPWNSDGTLEADKEPDEGNSNGIYCTKREDDRELIQIFDWLYSKYGGSQFIYKSVKVKVAISGTVIEGESGFRGQRARIISVGDEHGNWQSYQETYESSRRYYRPQTYYNPWNEKE